MHKSEDLKQVECDMAFVHATLSRIPLESPPFELLLKQAALLYDKYPPDSIEENVDTRMEKIRASLMGPPRKLPLPQPPSTSSTRRTFLKNLIFITAPVLIGVLLYRYVHQNQQLF